MQGDTREGGQNLNSFLMHSFGVLLAGYGRDKSPEDRQGSDRARVYDKAAMGNHLFLNNMCFRAHLLFLCSVPSVEAL